MLKWDKKNKSSEYGTSLAWGETAFSQEAQQRIKVNSDSSQPGLIWEQDSQAQLSLQSEHDSWYSEYFMAGVSELTVVLATGQW